MVNLLIFHHIQTGLLYVFIVLLTQYKLYRAAFDPL